MEGSEGDTGADVPGATVGMGVGSGVTAAESDGSGDTETEDDGSRTLPGSVSDSTPGGVWTVVGEGLGGTVAGPDGAWSADSEGGDTQGAMGLKRSRSRGSVGSAGTIPSGAGGRGSCSGTGDSLGRPASSISIGGAGGT